MRHNKSGGFTLIELLIVIAIIGILAAVLIPNLLQARIRAFDTAAQSCARAIATAQEIVMIDTQAYGANLAALDPDMTNVCDDVDVTDTTDFATAGWAVEHPNGSGAIFTVSAGGIQ